MPQAKTCPLSHRKTFSGSSQVSFTILAEVTSQHPWRFYEPKFPMNSKQNETLTLVSASQCRQPCIMRELWPYSRQCELI